MSVAIGQFKREQLHIRPSSEGVLLDEPIPARGSLGIWKYKPEESSSA